MIDFQCCQCKKKQWLLNQMLQSKTQHLSVSSVFTAILHQDLASCYFTKQQWQWNCTTHYNSSILQSAVNTCADPWGWRYLCGSWVNYALLHLMIVRILPEGKKNVCIKFHGNPTNHLSGHFKRKRWSHHGNPQIHPVDIKIFRITSDLLKEDACNQQSLWDLFFWMSW